MLLNNCKHVLLISKKTLFDFMIDDSKVNKNIQFCMADFEKSFSNCKRY